MELIRFAATSELYSYILLIPFISLYLVWSQRQSLPVSTQPDRRLAGVFLALGSALTVAYWLWFRSRLRMAEADYLAVMTVCFLLFFLGICCLFWGKETLRAITFPLAFLVFITPIPEAAIGRIDSFLQNGSAVAAGWFFQVSGTPCLQDGLEFQLSDIRIAIAPECSGIHSTLVLFITSLLGSYIFLRTPWKRALLTLFVIPLGLLRNGFRVFVIGQLCIHVGPQMIDSPIHRKGGPIFFALSLVPLFILLIVLQKSEKGAKKRNLKTSKINHE